jgi:DNA-binding GntR family transcriptional regulator
MRQQSAGQPYRHVSVVDGVAATLRDWIIEGQLRPGAQLKEIELAERLQISRHSLRTAIQLLTREGLLRRERNRGAFVIALTANEVEDLQIMRQAIESQAASLAIERKLDLSPLMKIVEAFERLRPDAPILEANNLDIQFHRQLLEIVGSPRLLQAFDDIEPQIRIMLAEPRLSFEHDAKVHRELFEALSSKDVNKAREGIRQHLAGSRAEALRAISER